LPAQRFGLPDRLPDGDHGVRIGLFLPEAGRLTLLGHNDGHPQFFAIVAKMQDAISPGVGEPDFDTPWHIREAGIYALEKGKTHYTSNLGFIELRRAINKYVEKNYAVSYAPTRRVHLDTFLVARPSTAAGSGSVSLPGPTVRRIRSARRRSNPQARTPALRFCHMMIRTVSRCTPTRRKTKSSSPSASAKALTSPAARSSIPGTR
jgi:hypothetical protein